MKFFKSDEQEVRFLTIFTSSLIAMIKTEDKYLKIGFNLFQLSCYVLSTYFMLFVFWDSQDFTISSYRTVFLVISVLIGVSFVYFISSMNVFKIREVERNREFKSEVIEWRIHLPF